MFGAHEVMYLVDNKQATDGLQIETHNIAIQSISVQGTVDLWSYIQWTFCAADWQIFANFDPKSMTPEISVIQMRKSLEGG